MGHRHHRTQDRQGKLCLCIVLDLFDQRVVGWSMHHRQDRQMVIRAVQMAVWQRRGSDPVILHSDRGSQFRSGDYQRYLAANELVCSMSAVGHCGDNAACEGFFGLLKRERVHRMTAQSRFQWKRFMSDGEHGAKGDGVDA